MYKRVPDTPFYGDFFPQVEKNKNSEIKIKLRKCIKECLTPLFKVEIRKCIKECLTPFLKMHKRVPDTPFYNKF